DQAGQPVRVTGHQFRHTLGTRLINSGVPQHVVQKLPGHASPGMTGHYAKVHDATIREAFDRYQSQRVDITGQRIGYHPGAPTASPPPRGGPAPPPPGPPPPSPPPTAPAHPSKPPPPPPPVSPAGTSSPRPCPCRFTGARPRPTAVSSPKPMPTARPGSPRTC